MQVGDLISIYRCSREGARLEEENGQSGAAMRKQQEDFDQWRKSQAPGAVSVNSSGARGKREVKERRVGAGRLEATRW